ncbi:porin family protein [Myxococcota bacterium]|nr:porin family protein [Myxococcota bacterium]MBU1429989.1 porin family protein [Myxococcota bacterium]MBU1898731.1 porin family protein [Myxococcota bacterium]
MRYIAILLSLSAFSLAHAQEAESGADNYTKAIRAGRGALVFSMGGLMTSTPGNMDGIGAGGRYMLSPDMALRVGFGLQNTTHAVDPDQGDKTEDKAGVWAVEAGVEFILRKKRNMMFYAGGIAQIGGQTNEPDGENNDDETSGYTIAGIAGVNWFFVENLSLGAEYRLGLTSQTYKDNDREITDDVYGVGSASFLVSFWF